MTLRHAPPPCVVATSCGAINATIQRCNNATMPLGDIAAIMQYGITAATRQRRNNARRRLCDADGEAIANVWKTWSWTTAINQVDASAFEDWLVSTPTTGYSRVLTRVAHGRTLGHCTVARRRMETGTQGVLKG